MQKLKLKDVFIVGNFNSPTLLIDRTDRKKNKDIRKSELSIWLTNNRT